MCPEARRGLEDCVGHIGSVKRVTDEFSLVTPCSTAHFHASSKKERGKVRLTAKDPRTAVSRHYSQRWNGTREAYHSLSRTSDLERRDA